MPLRLLAQLPQPLAGSICAVLVRGEICQIFTDQGVNGGVAFGRKTANGSQNLLVHTEGEIFRHVHSICVTVWPKTSKLTATETHMNIDKPIAL